jgi:hypothetical protein
MKLEEILKSQGWTDADLNAVKPLLENERFRESMETKYAAISTEVETLKDRDSQWQMRLDQEWQPRLTAEERKSQDLMQKLAQAQAQLKIAREYNYLPEEAEAKVAAAAAAVEKDAKTAEYVTKADLQQSYGQFSDLEGRAITMAHDIAAEYSYLTGGKSLFEYEAVVNGQQMRGMQALREECKGTRKPLDQFVAEKFDFPGKRSAMAAAKQKEHDDKIAAEAVERTRAEMAAQYGNPMMRTALPSHTPFIPKRPGTDKMPWEDGTEQDRAARRIARAVETQMKGPVQ